MQSTFQHPGLSYVPDITEITQPLTQLGVTFFTYMRSYNNGERVTLYRDGSYFEEYYTKKYYLLGNTEAHPAQYKKQIVLWSTLPNQHLYDAIPRAHGIDHGMFMINPNKDYCEFFAYATHKNNYKIINTYLTKLDYFQSFTDYFRDQAAGIIKVAETCKLLLPHTNKKLDFVEDHDINLLKLGNTNKNMLTARQIECCIHLMNGKTSKEIALVLGLSSRTVEYYLDNIKVKLNCKNRAELIMKLSMILTRAL